MYPGNPPLHVTHNVLNILSESGQVYGMPYGGVPGQGNKPGDYPGTLHAPPCAGQYSGPGGWEPPPTALSQVLHICHMAGVELETTGHRDVCQGYIVASEGFARGRGVSEHGRIFWGLYNTFGDGDGVQMPRKNTPITI